MVGMFCLRSAGDGAIGPVIARIGGELWALLFSSIARANDARQRLSLDDAQPFYICDANRADLLRELVAGGARGFILDYDPTHETYSHAGALGT